MILERLKKCVVLVRGGRNTLFSVKRTTLILIASASVLQACTLPRSGPSRASFFEGSPEKSGFRLIEAQDFIPSDNLCPITVDLDQFRQTEPSSTDIISVGDSISMTIYENMPDISLFGEEGRARSLLKLAEVDDEGFVFLPYVGRIKVAGLTYAEVQERATELTEQQTPYPQIVPVVARGDDPAIQIAGNVVRSKIVTLTPASSTLRTILAVEIPDTQDPDSVKVSLTRGTDHASFTYGSFLRASLADFELQAGDQLYVTSLDLEVFGFGAIGRPGVIKLTHSYMPLTEVIGLAGGVNPYLGDPTAVFVMRSVRTGNCVTSQTASSDQVVVRFDFSYPEDRRLADQFVMRDGDILYVPEAPAVQWAKMLQILGNEVSRAQSGSR